MVPVFSRHTAVAMLIAVASVAGPVRAEPMPPPEPAAFAQPFNRPADASPEANVPSGFATYNPAVSTIFPDYRLNVGDVLEIIYHVKTGVSRDAYRLKVEDVVSIVFPFQPQFDQKVTVQSDGTIRLVLLGEIQVVQRVLRGVNQFHFRQESMSPQGDDSGWRRYDPATKQWQPCPALVQGPDDEWLVQEQPGGPYQSIVRVLQAQDPSAGAKPILIDALDRTGRRDRYEFDHVRQRWRTRPVYVEQEGLTAAELEAELKKRYSEHLKSPELTVTVTQANIKIEELKKAITTAPRGQSRLMPVKPDGTVDLPFVGEVLAFGKTVQQLKTDIETAYEQVDLPEISVTVQINEWAPQKIFVLGEVNAPGLLNVPTAITLLQALAAAGGTNVRAAEDKIMVIRRKGLPVPEATIVNLHSILKKSPQAKAGDVPDFSNLRFDFYLSDADIIYVPSSDLAKTGDWVDMVFARIVRNIIPYNFYTGLNFGYELHRETAVSKTDRSGPPNVNVQVIP
ncbi:MAG TPA: polysaccharide biosynthesis/export family protein [Phycisphaerae bacterium]|nr:polysaccharide biosynthesis/export family protein [Phycisphaerae bacterium]HOJ75855.1 polysaccharide biosynthesis/export family protein [Phycisphaerae bacterium]HON65917.1 polysaccharide biosynthesis/export family protein [Phycisphaerae bacterium]HOQ85565.1 polysaccharide biosynthesis/export family protein [Phycisphaerae bacterium]HPP28423.1 polysaccharide biosynthesis/export family protein [Phycisphaerae bacterium]